jgi:hypothetical protein
MGWPGDLVGLVAVAVSGRIGPDRAFARWQRAASLIVAVALLLMAGSATGYAAALVAGAAYAMFAARREIGVRGSFRLAWRADGSRRAIVAGAMPVVALAGVAALAMWAGGLRSDWPALRGRPGLAGVPGIANLPHVGASSAAGRDPLVGSWPVAAPGAGPKSSGGLLGLVLGPGVGLGLLAGIALLIGVVRVFWRVTGPGLPLWVPVVGLGSLVSVVAAGTAGSPAWLLVACAELWVVCRTLRTDRDTAPPPRSLDRAVILPDQPEEPELALRPHP